VPHSWHDYQGYWRESVKLRQLCLEYGWNLDEFDGVLFKGCGRDLLERTDLHWEYGFRLLQLAVWRDLIRGYASDGVQSLSRVGNSPLSGTGCQPVSSGDSPAGTGLASHNPC
jgi:hypothetical protein